VNAVLAQAGWASVLAISGSYDTLTDSVVFASCLFYALAAGAVWVLRRKEPDLPRPFKTWGCCVHPARLRARVVVLVNALSRRRRPKLCSGSAFVLLGLPFLGFGSGTDQVKT
jgi:APA family basic amino acid/polyamine antiporter